MNIPRLVLSSLALLLPICGVSAADKFTVTVSNQAGLARPAEVIAVSFDEIKKRIPGMMFDHLEVKDADGKIIPAQGTNYQPEEHHDYYKDFVFQHDFATGEKTATFTIGKTTETVPPFPAKVFARYIPERFDDFAWENDRVGHRIYGPNLNTPAAGGSQVVCSGIDVWSKKVRYPIVDRWYVKGHYHEDTGEGLDMYDVGKARGAGGLGFWDGKTLHNSANWSAWKVLANGPIRAVFEISYAPWDAGNGVQVSEVKRFTVDAGHNLDLIESTFTYTAPSGGDGELTVGIGLTLHPKQAAETHAQDEGGQWFRVWEDFKSAQAGNLGTGVILDPGVKKAGFAEIPTDRLILAKVKSGEPLRYYAGAGWKQSGDFSSAADWDAYLAAWTKRLASPVTVSYSAP